MKLGIGAKAGLTGGVILTSIYLLGVVYLSWVDSQVESKLVTPPIFEESYFAAVFATLIGAVLFDIILFLGGYYYLLIKPEIYLSILLFSVYVALGRVFQSLNNVLPSESNTKKGIVFSIIVWLFLGITALLLYLAGTKPGIEKFQNFEVKAHMENLVGWIFYGFLLGKFYDAFSKEPDARIFYMIKKVLLSRLRSNTG